MILRKSDLYTSEFCSVFVLKDKVEEKNQY